jgi:FkbM family methyltransferase
MFWRIRRDTDAEGDTHYFKNIGSSLANFDAGISEEVIRHLDYLANKAGISRRDLTAGLPFTVNRQVQIDAIDNINAVIQSARSPDLPQPMSLHDVSAVPSSLPDHTNFGNRCLYLGDSKLLVRANWGGYMVVPSFNVDVAVGVVRDGIIEPWTTRLVQELTKVGDRVLNAGANFGYYVSLAGHLVGDQGKVYAIDANPHIIPYLLLTKHWSGLHGRVEIYNSALGAAEGVPGRFFFDPQFLGGGAIGDETVPIRELQSAIWSASSLSGLTLPGGRIEEEGGCYVSFDVTTTTIDRLVGDDVLDLIHLDIEGAEAYALLGAEKVINRSPNLRIITEWWGQRIPNNNHLLSASNSLWDSLAALGFRVRQLQPKTYPDGAISVSPPLTREFMMNDAPHGDYVWLRPQHDPWN